MNESLLGGPGEGPSAVLRAAVAADWDAAVGHRFVRELGAGTVPVEVLRRYLVQDNQFVDGFLALLGATVAAADTPEARLVHARQLGVVAGAENTYFRRSFDALGVPEQERSEPALLGPTVEFARLMAETGRSLDYAACVALLTVAEWLYLDWARQAPRPLPADPVAREWIELHDNPAFVEWVAFLCDELDRLVPTLDPAALDRCRRVFTEATRLERAFFDAVHPAG